MEIEVLNWGKYNPKRDQQTYTWLRLDNNIATDPKLYGLNAEQKFILIVILCECSRMNLGRISIDLNWLNDITKVKMSVIDQTFEFLKQKQIISIDDRALPQTAACATPTNERTNERTPAFSMRDFEKIYESYPRKIGKQKGLQKAKVQIKNEEDFARLTLAVMNYNQYCIRQCTEEKYIKHFDTFLTSWRDWLDMTPQIVKLKQLSDLETA